MEILDHWVNGAAFAGASTRTAPVYNPAEGTVSREVRLASTADVDVAVRAAQAAFPEWSDTSLAKRQGILFSFRELLNARKAEVAAILTNEHGKVTSDALGEVARGLEVVEFACGISHLLKGGHSEEASTGVDVHSKRVALGVVGPALLLIWGWS